MTVYYWDACIYLAWLKNEEAAHGKDRIDAIRHVADENFQKKNVIITSTLTFVEVTSSSLTEDQERKFRQSFRNQLHITYDLDIPIALKAREFREKFSNHASGKKLATPDAIHLATAAIYKANKFLTFDDGGKDKRSLGLLELDRNEHLDSLEICKPFVEQTSMFDLLPPPSN